jgi:hypothetical protein
MIAQTMSTDCAQFEAILNGLDSTRAPALAVPETALAHAESCGECARPLLETLFKTQASARGDRAVRE